MGCTNNGVRQFWSDPININSASLEELEAINGIGPELANAIISARQTKTITREQDLLDIPGIGPNLLDRIRNKIIFDSGD